MSTEGTITETTTEPTTTEPTITITSRNDELGEDDWYVEQRDTLMGATKTGSLSSVTKDTYEILNTLRTIVIEIGRAYMTGQNNLKYYNLANRETCKLYMGELTKLGHTVTMEKTWGRAIYLNISWPQDTVDEKEQE